MRPEDRARTVDNNDEQGARHASSIQRRAAQTAEASTGGEHALRAPRAHAPDGGGPAETFTARAARASVARSAEKCLASVSEIPADKEARGWTGNSSSSSSPFRTS